MNAQKYSTLVPLLKELWAEVQAKSPDSDGYAAIHILVNGSSYDVRTKDDPSIRMDVYYNEGNKTPSVASVESLFEAIPKIDKAEILKVEINRHKEAIARLEGMAELETLQQQIGSGVGYL